MEGDGRRRQGSEAAGGAKWLLLKREAAEQRTETIAMIPALRRQGDEDRNLEASLAALRYFFEKGWNNGSVGKVLAVWA